MATKTFSIRLTPERHEALKAAADGEGASSFARDAVLAAVEGRRRTRRQSERDQLHRSIAQMQATLMEVVDRVGLGRRLNADPVDDRPASAAEVAALRDEVHLFVSTLLRLGRSPGEGA